MEDGALTQPEDEVTINIGLPRDYIKYRVDVLSLITADIDFQRLP